MKKVFVGLITMVSVSGLFVACNSGGGGGGSSPAPVTAQVCTVAGQVQTAQYGCVAQCPNNPSMGMGPNGQCVPVISGGVATCGNGSYIQTAEGCLPPCPNNPSMGYLNGQCVAAGGYGGYGTGGYYGNTTGYIPPYTGSGYYNSGYYGSGYNPYYSPYSTWSSPTAYVVPTYYPGYNPYGYGAGAWFHIGY